MKPNLSSVTAAFVLCCAGVYLPAPALAEVTPPIHIFKVSAPDKQAYMQLFKMNLDIPEVPAGSEVTVVGTDAEKEWLEKQGYSVRYELRDAARQYAARAQAAGVTTFGGFRTLTECYSAIDSIIASAPSIVSTKLNIGMTDQGRPIYAIRISDNPNTDEGEPAILITGLHHAREPISTHIVIYTMQQLAQHYGTDSLITALVNEREIWFIPIVNPDGYAYNELTNPGGGGLWRKNRHNNGGTFGVDPNRNYGYHWGWDNVGSSPNGNDETYRGSGPFSEKEIQAIRNFVQARPNISIAANYHSYSNLFLWPPGFQESYTVDEPLFAAIGDSVTHWNNYTAEPGWGLYLTNGDSDDWMYFDQGILSFTFEVGNGADGFWPSPSRIQPLTDENYPANLFLIGLADQPERVLKPQAAVWDSISLVGTDSLGLFWQSPDTVTINKPVSFQVDELFGPHKISDGLETSDANWRLDRFTRVGGVSFQGNYSLYSGTGDAYTATAQMSEPVTVEAGDSLRCFMLYSTEPDWDYGYVEVSTDLGGTWQSIPGNLTTTYNPHGNNLGYGITGNSNGLWVPAWFDLADYVGQEVLIRLSYVTDANTNMYGFYVDNISPVQVYDSSSVSATTAAHSQILASHPEGDYHFRIQGEDAQGQVSSSQTRTFSYSTGPHYLLGDVDTSGAVTSADIVRLVNYVFKAGPAPLPVWESGDVDLSGAVTAADIIYLVNYVFKGGPPPGH